RDEEKATLIARLDDDIKEIKQSSASTSSVENSDICQPIRTEIKTILHLTAMSERTSRMLQLD
ncbi:2792_t:CDS:2, partial [Rhizophagus irregularis]